MKNNLHVAAIHMALDILRFAVFFILTPDTFALQRFPFNLFHLDGSDLQFLHSHPDHQLQDGLEQSADRVLWVIHANFQWLVGNFNPGKWFLSKPPLSKHLHLPMLDGSLQFSLIKATSSWGRTPWRFFLHHYLFWCCNWIGKKYFNIDITLYKLRIASWLFLSVYFITA